MIRWMDEIQETYELVLVATLLFEAVYCTDNFKSNDNA